MERRAQATGTTEDLCAWLLERTRVGALARERLGLAAYCGHEGAIAALAALGEEALTLEEFLTDPAFVVNPHGLDLPEEHLTTLTLVMSLATRAGEPCFARRWLAPACRALGKGARSSRAFMRRRSRPAPLS